MPEGPCFNQLWSEILLKNVTPRRADNRVKKSCREYYLIPPGYVFRGVPILISVSMLVGIDEELGRILIPFRKPCYGTSLYAINADRKEIACLRADLCGKEAAEPVTKPTAGKKRMKKSKG
ncbi:MAG: DUF1894 domain-containing protein [Methanoregulaceae archaeon]|nr:DUF1894 domain-containing protein [Methanoregulaceae archaeon]